VESISPIDAGQLLQRQFPEKVFFLDPLIFSSSIGMIYSPPGAGKTYFVLWLAAAIASGSWFLKYSAPDSRKVLYIDGEMTLQPLQERLEKLAISMPDVPPKNIKIIAPDMFKNGVTYPINYPSAAEFYAPATNEADVIILDNYCSLTSKTRSERTDEDVWEHVSPWLVQLRGQGKAVIIVHHAGKSGDYLGTSLKAQLLNFIVKLKPAFRLKHDKGIMIDCIFEKGRDIPDEEKEELFLNFIDYGNGLMWYYQEPDERKASVISFLRNRNWSDSDIAEMMGITKSHLKFIEKEIQDAKHWGSSKREEF